ncbi:MAG: formylglycine-generating enzyme family protein [Bacteroidia bacterium]
MKSRSLLNRDAEGNYKFSHKSILEYFLAKEAYDNPDFYDQMEFAGMDQALQFFSEMVQRPEMVLVEGGTFMMGENYEVTLSSYEIGKYPVTQRLWTEIMEGYPSHFQNNRDLPVEQVSWHDVQKFLGKLNKRYPGMDYRLPTEAEWEFAARGGNLSKGFEYAGSDNPNEIGWYRDNSKEKTHLVGLKKANELQIFDMSGNVWEWCADWYDDYPSSFHKNPSGPRKGTYRVVRGGSWYSFSGALRNSVRDGHAPGVRRSSMGFRLARSL